MSETIDAARLSFILNELRLPTIKHLWPKFAERADKESWPAARFLAAIAEHEITERDRRRMERNLNEAKLLPSKTLENFDFAAVPMISKAQISALCAGDNWLDKGANLILFGPPGGGKSHLCSAIGLALVEKGWRVLLTKTSDLVQKLQIARREFVLISTRYERRSLLITANQPFGEWGKIFPDPAMTLAAVDRLVHHATIFEMNVESYRRRVAADRKQQGAGRPPKQATIKNIESVSLRDNQTPT
jgi:DNA replication protein DnaC